MYQKPLRPFFRHFGSKWVLSGKYDPPNREIIIEPFAGSAGYSHRYGAGKEVRLYDIDPGTVEIWQWLLSSTPEDVLALPVDFGLQDVRTLDIPRPAMLLIQRWLTVQGTSSNYRFPPSALKWMIRNPGSYWSSYIRQRIADQLPKITRWSVELLDYRDIPIIEATWEVDPIYENNVYASAAYNLCPKIDYSHLSKWCQNLPGQVIVHEQEGASWLPFRSLETKARTGCTKSGKVKLQHEVVWTRETNPPLPIPTFSEVADLLSPQSPQSLCTKP